KIRKHLPCFLEDAENELTTSSRFILKNIADTPFKENIADTPFNGTKQKPQLCLFNQQQNQLRLLWQPQENSKSV
ncbi:hypothetical protein, partial [Colwellia marinimaniae]